MSGEAPKLGAAGKYEVNRDRFRFGATLADDEVAFETGFLIAPAALPAKPHGGETAPEFIKPPDEGTGGGDTDADESGGPDVENPPGKRTRLTLEFSATRAQLYKAFPALGNLAEKSDGQVVTIRVQASAAAGFDPSWLRNAVEEPLDEADIRRTKG